jgi:hypothetical protein
MYVRSGELGMLKKEKTLIATDYFIFIIMEKCKLRVFSNKTISTKNEFRRTHMDPRRMVSVKRYRYSLVHMPNVGLICDYVD